MKINSKKTAKAAAISLAAVMTCGLFAGCDLVISNSTKNMNQIVADVNITDSKSFASEFEGLDQALVKKVISTTSVAKRDMIVTFISAGYNAMSSYGWTYKDTFDAISNSLVSRQVYIQYAKAYFLKNGWTDPDDDNAETNTYTYNDLEKFNAAVKDKQGVEYTGVEYDIAALEYFLTEKEADKAKFSTRVKLNNSIDSIEKERYIEAEEDEHDHDEEVRTTPTGINTTDDDYYDNDYKIYTGTGKQNAVRGSYEAPEGSTVTTRQRAYNYVLSSLKSNDLIKKGEDTSDVETLDYFLLEYKNDLEDALIQKLMNVFIKEAESKIDKQYAEGKFAEILSTQRERFAASSSALESAMDSASDTSFVLTATGNSDEESAYGFVINILLPFSAAQSDELSSEKQDYGDTKGNNFGTRARLLKKIKATDQRGTWFTGEDNYGFKATAASDAYGYTADTARQGKSRQWLFFEDYLNDTTAKYERLNNYLGKYTYNGTWDEETGKYKPYAIDIDGFLGEMEGYINFALGEDNAAVMTQDNRSNYYKTTDYYKDENGVKVVDYEKFVYYAGEVNFPEGYNANKIFQKDTRENKVLSVINELSFAYNTDTGGLNSYLGYSVSANKTNFVSEFEYAAQQAVLNGAGSYIVVPSDYGWHIIYCTFSFVDSVATSDGIRTPYQYNDAEKTVEGSFSYLFYESLKKSSASTESSNRQSMIITTFKDSYKVYEDRYEDLANLG